MYKSQSVVGAFLSYYAIRLLARKSILAGGHFLMGVLLFLMAYMTIKREEDMVLIFMCLFIITFQSSSGSLMYIYIAEICRSDSVLGACMLTCMLS